MHPKIGTRQPTVGHHLGMRSAVNVDQNRVFFIRIKVCRLNHAVEQFAAVNPFDIANFRSPDVVVG